MNKILITGANGQIGQELVALANQFPHFQFIATNREQLDLADFQSVEDFFKQQSFDCCINCAAYTAVDKAESEQETAFLINRDAVGLLAKLCAQKGIPLIHFSTDYVYHSLQNTPFKESDATHAESVYAKSKLAGEQLALQYHASSMIIRTSWVYSYFGHNFVKTMLRLGRERDQLRVVFDQIGTPTYAHDIAKMVLQLLSEPSNMHQMKGIFHYSNEGVTSWYDFARAIFELSAIKCQVSPIESKDYPTPAKRPPFSLMNKEKIKRTFNIEIPHWRSSLKHCLKRLADNISL